MALATKSSDEFAETGYLGPVRVLSTGDCRRFLRTVDLRPQASLDWGKGIAAASRAYYEFATLPQIVDVVVELLGDEVLLWGASIATRGPNAVHAWHSDIESSDPDARTVSVWIGLEHTTRESSLDVLSHSHWLGATIQQIQQEAGKGRDETRVEDLVGWAKERDSRCELVRVSVTDGEAVFFDGRLWHGTHNVSSKTRRALLLQYAAPDTAIRIPDLNHLDWPFRQLDRPWPPCLIVRGSAQVSSNRVVPAPVDTSSSGMQLTSRIHPLRLPLELNGQDGWRPHPAFRGSTANLADLSCHASVLVSGHSPHPPHSHVEEELLLLLEGEVELVFSETERTALRAGEFVYYPERFAHTLETTSDEPAMYVMFKWRGEEAKADSPLPFGRFETAGGDGSRTGMLFEGPTVHLRKLHSHVTVLEPGDGYEPHVDAYDVAIVVLEGEVQTIGGRAVPHDVIFYLAGEAHGMRNVGVGAARYVVFEFHGGSALVPDAPSAARALLAKLSDPRRWKRKLRRLARR